MSNTTLISQTKNFFFVINILFFIPSDYACDLHSIPSASRPTTPPIPRDPSSLELVVTTLVLAPKKYSYSSSSRADVCIKENTSSESNTPDSYTSDHYKIKK